jgi:hypothetical protein
MIKYLYSNIVDLSNIFQSNPNGNTKFSSYYNNLNNFNLLSSNTKFKAIEAQPNIGYKITSTDISEMYAAYYIDYKSSTTTAVSIPPNVKTLRIISWGGGGAGGSGASYYWGGRAGDGAPGAKGANVSGNIILSTTSTYNVVVGTGGDGAQGSGKSNYPTPYNSGNNGGNGNASYVVWDNTTYALANGGSGGSGSPGKTTVPAPSNATPQDAYDLIIGSNEYGNGSSGSDGRNGGGSSSATSPGKNGYVRIYYIY